jgi:exopolysaccharide biosynthesis polyprenyl glycosylphosphotransferase
MLENMVSNWRSGTGEQSHDDGIGAVESASSVEGERPDSPLSVTEETRPALRLKRRLMLADALAITVAIIVSFQAQMFLKPVPQHLAYKQLALLLVALPTFAVAAGLNRLYLARANERVREEFWNIVKAVGTSIAALLTASFLIQYYDLSRLWVILLGLSMTAALAIERHMARRMFAKLRSTGQISRRIVIVGTDSHAVGLLHTYQRRPELGYKVVGFVGDDDLGRRGGVEVLGPVTDIDRILPEHQAVGAVVSLASVSQDEVNSLTRRLTEQGYHVALSSTLRDIDITRLRPQDLDGRTMIYVEPVLRGGWRAVAKRIFDLAVATSILVLSAPILLGAIVAIRVNSPGPVFFKQVRVGRHGETFRLIKLRTMVVDAEERKADLAHLNEADGALFKIREDPRITKVGRVLRKLSIDELPQLFNVLQGTMSMVGPRPALPDEVAKWDDEVVERLRVLPGLTGMWQVWGRSDTSFETYKRLDLYYVDNWSLAHDLRICARTVGVVLTGRGAA